MNDLPKPDDPSQARADLDCHHSNPVSEPGHLPPGPPQYVTVTFITRPRASPGRPGPTSTSGTEAIARLHDPSLILRVFDGHRRPRRACRQGRPLAHSADRRRSGAVSPGKQNRSGLFRHCDGLVQSGIRQCLHRRLLVCDRPIPPRPGTVDGGAHQPEHQSVQGGRGQYSAR